MKQLYFLKNFKTLHWVYLFIMIILSLILLSNISLSSKGTHSIEPSVQLTTIHDSNGRNIELPLTPGLFSNTGNHSLTFQITIPKDIGSNQEILFSTTNQKITASIDGDTIYQYVDQNGSSLPQGELGTVWHFIKIPTPTPLQVDITITPSVANYGYNISTFHLGTVAANENYIYQTSTYENLIAIVFFVLLIITIFLLLSFGKENFIEHKYYWKLIVFLIAISLLYVIEGRRVVTYFYHPLLLLIIQQIAFITIPLSFFSFLCNLYKKHFTDHTWIHIGYITLCITSVLYLLLYLVEWVSWKYLSFAYFIIIIVYTIIFIKQLWTYLWQQKNIYCLFLLLIGFISSLWCNYQYVLYSDFRNFVIIIIPIILLVIIYIKRFINDLNYLFLNQQLAQQTEFYHHLSLEHKEIRILNHDMKNHLLTIETLLKQNNYTEALNYLHATSASITSAQKVISTSNPTIDAVLTAKRSMAIEKGIDIVYDINIAPNLTITPFDFCIIFNNLLDNAIEACLRSQKEKLSITTNIYMRGNNMILKIENTYDKDSLTLQKGNLKTSKEDKKMHGHGLLSVRQCVAQYQGNILFTPKEDTFLTTVVLQNIINTKKEAL